MKTRLTFTVTDPGCMPRSVGTHRSRYRRGSVLPHTLWSHYGGQHTRQRLVSENHSPSPPSLGATVRTRLPITASAIWTVEVGYWFAAGRWGLPFPVENAVWQVLAEREEHADQVHVNSDRRIRAVV